MSPASCAGEAVSRIGQRLEKTPEATFLPELDEKNTNLRDALPADFERSYVHAITS
jgi:hypothetical protein